MHKFDLETTEIFVPDGLPVTEALARTTHAAIVAHQDDIEIMACHGILECFQRDDKWFCGVVVTDGSGSPRDGAYKDYDDEAMRAVRRKEQKKAALVGEYAAQIQLDYPSAAVKDATAKKQLFGKTQNPALAVSRKMKDTKGVLGANQSPVKEIALLLQATRPDVVYTHNLADKHDTHVAVALRVIEALRSLPAGERPRCLYGCEVWRGLDWLADADKVAFDCSARENLQAALLGVYDSQIGGGKRYDLATLGRRRANATYHASHSADSATGMIFAMDLTPLIQEPTRDIQTYVHEFIDRLARDVAGRLARLQ